ncbi:MAG TPA: toll/interleukin-1 receptor domain-containing protein [Pyrinomonadaceae bacterium]|nr:toll/interleukin-1 receptor domain-containing protein [Pyrinomonadaceae bacterium]
MSSTQSFIDDVFISYRHLDNDLLDEHGKGWIDNFHERFESLLREALGYKPMIWRDPRPLNYTSFTEESRERLKKTAVMIAILSPGYVQSDWCLGELNEFCRLADQAGGLLVGNKMRVFKVLKAPIEHYLQPPELASLLGYEFFGIDMTHRPVPFRQELGRNRDQRYWNKLDDLAWDVKQILWEIKTRLATSPAASVSITDQKDHLSRQDNEERQRSVLSNRGQLAAPSLAEPPPQLSQKHEVFISHASEDLKIASLVRTALEEAGIGCWMAHDDIIPSEIYSRAIIKAMNLSRLVLLVFTSNANVSRHIETEIDRAYNKEKPIILFRIEDIPLSESLEYYVSTRSWLIATEPPVDKHLPKLIVKVKQLCR